ncbi:hypothetical protein ACFQJD_11365 [Haloplanus sp. GCM10025708]|uniref:hypothetical protein n=1 Tax=Haloferacaceae TaxID=1644056 RepID=UPI003610A711
MTGPLGRVRAWIGSLFGAGESDDEPDGETAKSTTGGATPESTSAGDETPESTAEVTAEALEKAIANAEATPTTETVRRETPSADDADGAADSPFELEGGPQTVRVPAEETTVADQATADGDGATDAAAGSETDDAATTDDSVTDGTATDGTAADDAEPSPTDYAYRCTVCGTGVETPDDHCPLCHSSEIAPADDAGDVYDSAGDESAETEAAEPVGQKTTSISDADDAVERLRDLRHDEE